MTFLFHGLAVQCNICKGEPINCFDDIRFGNSVELTSFEAEVLDRRPLISLHPDRVFPLLTGQISDAEIPDDRSKFSGIALFVEEIYFQDRLAYFTNANIPGEEVLHDSPADRIRLEPQCAFKVVTVHDTVLGKHVPDAARDLASEDDTPVPFFHIAALDHDIFARYVDAPAVRIPPRFDRNAIIARIEEAVFDQN